VTYGNSGDEGLDGPLNKIDDYRLGDPPVYKKCMRTSAVIYADEKMIKQIRDDNAPEQAATWPAFPGSSAGSLAMLISTGEPGSSIEAWRDGRRRRCDPPGGMVSISTAYARALG